MGDAASEPRAICPGRAWSRGKALLALSVPPAVKTSPNHSRLGYGSKVTAVDFHEAFIRPWTSWFLSHASNVALQRTAGERFARSRAIASSAVIPSSISA